MQQRFDLLDTSFQFPTNLIFVKLALLKLYMALLNFSGNLILLFMLNMIAI